MSIPTWIGIGWVQNITAGPWNYINVHYFVWILAKKCFGELELKGCLPMCRVHGTWFQNMQPGLRLSIRLHHSACCSHHHCEGETALEPIRAGHSGDHAHRDELLCNFHPRVSASVASTTVWGVVASLSYNNFLLAVCVCKSERGHVWQPGFLYSTLGPLASPSCTKHISATDSSPQPKPGRLEQHLVTWLVLSTSSRCCDIS